ncbi:MAG: carbohydrate ABC transporter permease [Clostridia bacterium]|nr:carbohydrate ABC transporter permease [Clostridia bacterium]
MKQREGIGSRIFDGINIGIMVVIIAVSIYPLIYLISKSLSGVEYVKANLVYLYPRGFNLDAYRDVIKNTLFWISYKNTIVYTVIGTVLNLAFTSSMAFCLSRRELLFRKTITMLVIFTMFFGGGLIPNFLLVKWLGMYDTMWSLILPGTISTYNMIIVRTYMKTIPEDVIESVRIDGGNELQIFYKIILPLSKPVLATIGLFYAIGHWNSYFNAMIYLKTNIKFPVQLVLKEMIVDQNMQSVSTAAYESLNQQPLTSEMLVAASIVITLIPVLIIYPFVQKFFVKGIMIGSVKG